MRKFLKMFPAALLACASVPAFSQVVPAAGPTAVASPPLSVGFAYSNFNSDYNSSLGSGGRLNGATIWADWNFYNAPPLWDGFGIEVEGRELNHGRSGDDPKPRQETIAGGAIYTTHFYRRFHPYAKFLVGLGGTYFGADPSQPNYTHDTRTVFAPGVGADTRFYKSLWLRVNYEIQFWPDFARGHTLNPNGIDIGVSYDFKAFR
jgi:opacity protein-like surface antigen